LQVKLWRTAAQAVLLRQGRRFRHEFTGDSVDDPLYQKFTDKFHSSPLIKALNQEAKGRFAVAFRQGMQFMGALYYSIMRTRSVFRNQKSRLSYIPARTFSAALLQQIHLKEFSQKVGELAARKFRSVYSGAEHGGKAG